MSRSTRASAHTRSLGQKSSACNAGPSACAANPPVIGAIEQAERLVAEMTREGRGPGPTRPVIVLVPLALDDHYAATRVLSSATEIQPDVIPSPLPPNLLTQAERRVLRHLPTNLSESEIAVELFCSVNTIKTHIRHVYAKLQANNRTEAVKRACALGLLTSTNGRISRPPAVRLPYQPLTLRREDPGDRACELA